MERGTMRFGLFAINMGVCSQPEIAAQVAQAAEAAGFESAWTGEHVVLPDPRVSPAPLPPDHPLLDPAVALAFIAGQTRTIRLGTGIIILPQRNPFVLAKELASLDRERSSKSSAALCSARSTHLLLPLPVRFKQRATGSPQPMTSCVAS